MCFSRADLGVQMLPFDAGGAPKGCTQLRVHTESLSILWVKAAQLVSMATALLQMSHCPRVTVRRTSLVRLLFRQLFVAVMFYSCPDITKSGSHFRSCSCSSLVKTSTQGWLQHAVWCLCSVQQTVMLFIKGIVF